MDIIARGAGPMGVGLVGCGDVVRRFHLPALRQVRELQVVAIACPEGLPSGSPDTIRRHRDHLALLEDPAVEVVGVCSPAGTHGEVAAAALAARRHVLIEKPPALGLDEWDRVIDAAASSSGVALLGTNMRRLPAVARMREAIRAGGLGRVGAIATVLTGDAAQKRATMPWRADRLTGGGALVEKAVHHLDLCRFLLDDEIEEVFAVASRGDEDVSITALMENGATATILASDRLSYRNEIRVMGSDGALAARIDRAHGLGDRILARRTGGAYLGSFVAEWRDLVEAVRTGTPPEPGLESGRRLLQVLLAAAASAATGRPVRRVDAPRTLAPPG